MTPATTVATLRGIFKAAAEESYGESVTMAQHFLATAAAAQREGADEALVVACLLHDIGHFLEAPDDAFGLHDHGRAGASFLADRFPPEVSEPVRLHVEAKRYLCAVDPKYHDQLSPASQYTLTRQGGVMTPEEAEAFAALPHAEAAIRLRRWEDLHGKRADQAVPVFARYEPAIVRQHLNDTA